MHYYWRRSFTMKRRRWFNKSLVTGCLCLCLFSFAAHGQIKVSENDSIQYSSALQSFFAGLDSLRAGKDTVLTIVHLGDSHIQAGYFSGRTMRLLQAEFGNAGRGWIAPFKLARLNEPDDYFFSSNIRQWVNARVTKRPSQRHTSIGPGAVGIETTAHPINLTISMAPMNGAGYSFNQAIFYRGGKAMPMQPIGKYKDSVAIALSSEICAPNVIADTFRIKGLIDTLQLQSSRRKPGETKVSPASAFRNIYYGASLTNGKPGILYHSIGVNGSMYVNYTDEEYLSRLAVLQPDLLIVSLGTNETFGRNFRSAEFSSQIEAFLSIVKKLMPKTAILLTTPPECYKRTYVNKKRVYVRNKQTEQAAKTILEVAQRQGLACWDMFTATGGAESCEKWQEAGLLRKDRVHFTKEGYFEQATYLYRALMNTYNQFTTNQYVQ